jgi:hypothetical protein
VIISEFGVWGLSEPSKILDFYKGRPHWFDAQWAGHTEEFKRPATAERNLARFGLARLFGDADGLARACQGRMMRALKPLIEAMRRRPDLAGYVVTELTDVEWETNGWMDYFREPKAPPALFAAFNGPVVVMVDLARHVVWDDGRFEGMLAVSNHTGETLEGRIRWQVPGTPHEGAVPVTIHPHQSGTIARIGFAAPRVEGHARLALRLALEVDGRVVAENAEELHVVARALGQAEGLPAMHLHAGARDLAAALGEAGLARGEETGLWLSDRLDEAVRARLEAGGRVLLVAEDGEASADTGFVSFRKLPPGESWDRASSNLFVRPDLFPALGLDPLPGWEWEGMFPRHVVPLTPYLHDFGGRLVTVDTNQGGLGAERILGGYFEGWVGKVGATIACVPFGAGELLVTTLPLLSAYGKQPIATAMLHRLIAIAQAPLPATHAR